VCGDKLLHDGAQRLVNFFHFVQVDCYNGVTRARAFHVLLKFGLVFCQWIVEVFEVQRSCSSREML